MDNFLQTFFDWDLISEVLPDLLTTGIKNTLLLALGASVVGFVVALPLALMGLSTRWFLRWPARVFTDVFRGLPAILTILLFGQALSPLGMSLLRAVAVPAGHRGARADHRARTPARSCAPASRAWRRASSRRPGRSA